MMHAWTWTGSLAWFAVVPFTGLAASAGAAQQAMPTILEGLTIDAESGLPFPNVQIRFDTGQRITSDERGRYAIEGLPPGDHTVALVTGRCSVSFATVTLLENEIRQTAFGVPSEMVGIGPSADEMKRRSEGSYYSAEEIEQMGNRTLLDVLRRVSPDMVGPQNGLPGAAPALNSRVRTAQGSTPPMVVVDEIVVTDGVHVLGGLRTSEVFSLEILRGASRGWEYGTGGAGGVIKVVTRQGDIGYGVYDPDRCEVDGWPAASGAA